MIGEDKPKMNPPRGAQITVPGTINEGAPQPAPSIPVGPAEPARAPAEPEPDPTVEVPEPAGDPPDDSEDDGADGEKRPKRSRRH